MLISSRDPFAHRNTEDFYALAASLQEADNEVTLFLVQNGVLPARACATSTVLTALSEAGVKVRADAFSLRERGIPTQRLADGVSVAELDTVIDHLETGSKTLWS
jgi:sulfur relay (sulfurtransferase) complex TusBCD TusD component (DsrE family)